MAHSNLAFPADSFLEQILRVVDRAYTDECHNPRCPVVGLHNLDECADLIVQAESEVR